MGDWLILNRFQKQKYWEDKPDHEGSFRTGVQDLNYQDVLFMSACFIGLKEGIFTTSYDDVIGEKIVHPDLKLEAKGGIIKDGANKYRTISMQRTAESAYLSYCASHKRAIMLRNEVYEIGYVEGDDLHEMFKKFNELKCEDGVTTNRVTKAITSAVQIGLPAATFESDLVSATERSALKLRKVYADAHRSAAEILKSSGLVYEANVGAIVSYAFLWKSIPGSIRYSTGKGELGTAKAMKSVHVHTM